MGIEVEPGEKGDDCPHCTPDIWEPGHTPKHLLVMVTGIVSCPAPPPIHPAPPDGEWLLTQNPAAPCQWFKIVEEFDLLYRVFVDKTIFQIRDVDGFLAFDASQAEPCWAYFANSVVCAPDVNYHEGSAFIDLYDFPGTAYQLMHEYNLGPAEHTKFEVHEVPAEPPYVQVRRFGNIRTPMNIAIKTDATHKDQYEMFEK